MLDDHPLVHLMPGAGVVHSISFALALTTIRCDGRSGSPQAPQRASPQRNFSCPVPHAAALGRPPTPRHEYNNGSFRNQIIAIRWQSARPWHARYTGRALTPASRHAQVQTGFNVSTGISRCRLAQRQCRVPVSTSQIFVDVGASFRRPHRNSARTSLNTGSSVTHFVRQLNYPGPRFY